MERLLKLELVDQRGVHVLLQFRIDTIQFFGAITHIKRNIKKSNQVFKDVVFSLYFICFVYNYLLIYF
jgi:LytS/YehU family sensor histidine kinase